MSDTIAAISTPVGEGGIGIVRLSGPESLSILKKIFQPARKIEKYKSHKIYYGKIKSGQTLIDEVLVSVMLAPQTYTRQDIVEINCHAGYMAVRKILELLIRSGARIAEKGEFTRRAFLSGRIDLSQAEAIHDLIRARSERDLENAVSQLEGGLRKTISQISKMAEALIVELEAGLNLEDEEDTDQGHIEKEIEKIKSSIEELIATADYGRIIRRGINIAITGRTNVGKSSLLNYIIKKERAIVTDIPGTTRDVIEEDINIKGIAITLQDTAGIRESDDTVEKEGIKRTMMTTESADIVLFVLDASEDIKKEDRDIYKRIASKKNIIIANKTDIAKEQIGEKIEGAFGQKPLMLSAMEQKGIEKLEDRVLEIVLSSSEVETSGNIITNIRHLSALEQARACVLRAREAQNKNMPECVAEDLLSCRRELGKITGEFTAEDVITNIFEDYCVGK